MRVVSNTSPLVAYAHARLLWVLRDLFGEILIPAAVRDEIAAKSESTSAREIVAAAWIQHRALSGAPSPGPLDPGEADAIALAQEVRADLLLLDDMAGPIAATRAGLAILGSVEVLLRGFEVGVVEDPTACLHSLRDAGHCLSDRLTEQFGQAVEAVSRRKTGGHGSP